MTRSKHVTGAGPQPTTIFTLQEYCLMAVGLVLSIALLAGPLGSGTLVAQQPEASPSDVTESPSDAPPPVAEEPVAEEPVAEEAVAEAKPVCPATCRPRPLARLRARLRCCLGRLGCRVSCCQPEPAVDDVPACAPAKSAEVERSIPVQFVSEPKPADAPQKSKPHAFQPIFDGKTLKGWKVPNFGGQGEVKVEKGAITLEMGADMTGITYQGKVPQTNYELEFEAQRVQGNDFFAATTFRVGKNPLTFVVGGWGGTVVGLSNVDFYDASDNMTTQFHDFKEKTWYKIRIRVTDVKVECWIDDKKLVNQHREGHKFDIRWECELCKPLGISTWCTSAALKNIRMRTLSPKEVEAAAEEAKKEKNEPSFG